MASLLMVADDDDAVDRGAGRCPLVLRPLAEVLDAAHRCIVTLQDHVVNPAIPPPMRDHGLASLQGVFRLAQQRVLLPRLLCLCEAMLDIARDLDLLRRDVRAASDSPRFYAFVHPAVRRCIRLQHQQQQQHRPQPGTGTTTTAPAPAPPLGGPNTLVSSMLTLWLALSPFDAFWWCVIAAGGYQELLAPAAGGAEGGAAALAARLELSRQLAQLWWLHAASIEFALPPSTAAGDSPGVVVGAASSWRRTPAATAPGPLPWPPGSAALDDVGSPSAATAPSSFDGHAAEAHTRQLATLGPPVADGAPAVARVGALATVAGRLAACGLGLAGDHARIITNGDRGGEGGPTVEQDDGPHVVRSRLRRQPPTTAAGAGASRPAGAIDDGSLSLRSREVAAYLHGGAAAGVARRSPPAAGERRAAGGSGTLDGDGPAKRRGPRPEQRPVVVGRGPGCSCGGEGTGNNGQPPKPRRRLVVLGAGLPGLATDVQRHVLLFLPPRAIRAAQLTCRRLAAIVAGTPSLRTAAHLSLDFTQRLAWFFADEWGERLRTLPTLPAPDSLAAMVDVVYPSQRQDASVATRATTPQQ